MKFYTNTITTQGKVKSLEEFASGLLNKKTGEPLIKTASATKVVKIAESEEEESSGQPEWEGKKENVNEPKDKSEDKDCYAEDGSEKIEKEAKWNFEKGDKDEDKKDEKDDCKDKKDEDCADKDKKEDKKEDMKEAKTKKQTKVAEDKKEDKPKKKESNDEKSSGQLDVEPLHQKGESENASKVNDSNKKEATNSRLVKISKLDNKTKSMLVEYYKKYYPESYVQALVKEDK